MQNFVMCHCLEVSMKLNAACLLAFAWRDRVCILAEVLSEHRLNSCQQYYCLMQLAQ
jgi:hypothetical protein